MKEEKISMPMASAGIVGMSPDIKIAGYEIDAKVIIIIALVFTLAIKLTTAVLRYL